MTKEKWRPNYVDKCNWVLYLDRPDYCHGKSVKFYIYDMAYFTDVKSDSYFTPPVGDPDYATCALGRCEKHLPEKLAPWSPFKETSYEEAITYEIMTT